MRARDVVIDAQVSGFGDTAQPMSETERIYVSGKMTATIAALKSAMAIARAKVIATPNALVGTLLNVGTALLSAGLLNRFLPTSAPAEVKQNVLNGLTSLERGMQTNLIDKMSAVLDGTLAPDRWFKMAQTYVDGIKSMLMTLEEDSTLNVLSVSWEGIQKDTADFLRKFKQGVETTFDFMPLIVGGAAVIAVIMLVDRVVPRRSLSGYNRRRRRIKRLN